MRCPLPIAALTLLCGVAISTVATAQGGKSAPESKDALFDLADEKEVSSEVLPASKEALFGADEETKDAKVAPTSPPLPSSKEALFADEPELATPAAPQLNSASPSPLATPDSKADLFDLPPDLPKIEVPDPIPSKSAVAKTPDRKMRGYLQTELARTYASPAHWSKIQGRLELGTQGRLSNGAKWKASGRIDYNAVYDVTDFYQNAVQENQRSEFQVRETYLDFSAADWEWRVGRQNIVWGEMVGMFLADVVSAKDMREFILPDFQVMRIPQWAARAEYFADDFHFETIWIPFPSYDRIGKPTNFAIPGSGTDFYPYPPVPGIPAFLKEQTPSSSLAHTNLGINMSMLKNGWDMSGFIYSSMNSAASYYQVSPNVYQPRHDRIGQAGGSLAKDLGSFVLKAEAVYTHGRKLNRTTTGNAVEQQMLDWAVGLDFNPDVDTRVNTQFFQSHIFDRDAAVLPDQNENGVSLYISRALPNKWRAEFLLMSSLNRADWLARPKLIWGFQPDWKLTVGVDVFSGPATGFFGQFDHQDRAYAEVRYDF